MFKKKKKTDSGRFIQTKGKEKEVTYGQLNKRTDDENKKGEETTSLKDVKKKRRKG